MALISIDQVLRYEEGYEDEVYYCSEGYPTIGIGTKLGPKNAPLEHYTFKVNYQVARALLVFELEKTEGRLSILPWFIDLDRDRKIIILSMAYQMGVTGVLQFKKMLKALEAEDWEEAKIQALDSTWAKQTPQRAKRHADVLLMGDLGITYGDI